MDMVNYPSALHSAVLATITSLSFLHFLFHAHSTEYSDCKFPDYATSVNNMGPATPRFTSFQDTLWL
jgi:hypothetical protein